MRGVVVAARLAAAGGSLAAHDAAAGEVLGAVDGFLDAMGAKDSAGMAARIDGTARFTLLREGPNGTRIMVLSGRELIRLTARPDGPSYHEPTRNPIVQIDGDLASVWAEYQVIVDGAVRHCGHDAVRLARFGGRWKMIKLSDTLRREGCGPAWASK